MGSKNITRRQALARLGLTPVTVYAVPAILSLSTAAYASGASKASRASDPTVPTPPTPPTQPSTPSAQGQSNGPEIEERASDYCRENDVGNGSDTPVISQRDFELAQQSVEAGYAKPLRQIWTDIAAQYSGRIVSVSFTGFRYRPRYRLRAVSASGRLETVVVSARTGEILRIVGC